MSESPSGPSSWATYPLATVDGAPGHGAAALLDAFLDVDAPWSNAPEREATTGAMGQLAS